MASAVASQICPCPTGARAVAAVQGQQQQQRSACPATVRAACSTSASFGSSFNGARLAVSAPARSAPAAALRVNAALAEAKEFKPPTWGKFEMGTSPVYFDPNPTAGETMTIYFNAEVNDILNTSSGVRFNGGFNGPFMCGGEPRQMAEVSRGEADMPFYSIRINVPVHAIYLEFSFTDGSSWDEGYKLTFKRSKGLDGKDKAFMDNGLSLEMSEDGACEASIFPDPLPEPDTVDATVSVGATCDLDIVVGSTDPDSPAYNPFATVEGKDVDFDV